MRGAMICVSVMLAVLQLWPIIFSRSTTRPIPANAPFARQIGANTLPKPLPTFVRDNPKPTSHFTQLLEEEPVIDCDKSYRRALQACAPSDDHCHLRAADRFDLCDARGFLSQ